MPFKKSLLSALVVASTLTLLPGLAEAKLPLSVNGTELPTLAPMLEKATPAVVSVKVLGSKEVKQRYVDPFEFFYGPRGRGTPSQRQPFQSLGSGVIIDAEKGYIVTNHHVIDDADEITISLKDGREFKAKKLGSHPESDVALLQIEADGLTELKIADSDKIRVGDFAVAIGNPFGLSHTVTSGIISALGRSGLNIENVEDFIQTDAAINQGNSGGALVNLNGELVGINTAILGASGGNVGIGFAIPSNMMRAIVDQLAEKGEVTRGVMGIRGGNLSPDVAKALELDVHQGCYVQEVIEGSAAEEAGLKAGDVIVEINGKPIKSFNEVIAKVATLGAGKDVKVTVLRDGKKKIYTVTLKAEQVDGKAAENIHRMLAGAQLSNADDIVVIDSVEANSPAFAIGLRQGDQILAVNNKRVANLSELKAQIQNPEGTYVISLKRGRTAISLIIR